MKRDGRYRFSLQFGAETESQVRAGELLEKLGIELDIHAKTKRLSSMHIWRRTLSCVRPH